MDYNIKRNIYNSCRSIIGIEEIINIPVKTANGHSNNEASQDNPSMRQQLELVYFCMDWHSEFISGCYLI
mgnify:CR=1 FL=1